MIVATCSVAVVQGILLFFYWFRDNRPLTLALTSIAFVCFGVGFALIGGRNFLAAGVGSAVGSCFMFLSGALFVTAARRIGRRRTPALLVAAAPLLWLAAIYFVPTMSDPGARATFLSTFMATCFAVCAFECWRSQDRDSSISLWPLRIVALLFCGMFVLRAIFNADLPFPLGALPPDGNLTFSVASLAVFVLLAVVAFLVVGFTHERMETERGLQAVVDPVTGALRRGAFALQGARVIGRHHADGRSACLALVSLAAPVGDVDDRTLGLLSRAASEVLRPTDMMARMGACEFAFLLGDTVIGEATDITQRLIQRFRDLSGDAHVPVFARAGIASSTQTGNNIRGLVQAADLALKSARFSDGTVVAWHPGLEREAGRLARFRAVS